MKTYTHKKITHLLSGCENNEHNFISLPILIQAITSNSDDNWPNDIYIKSSNYYSCFASGDSDPRGGVVKIVFRFWIDISISFLYSNFWMAKQFAVHRKLRLFIKSVERHLKKNLQLHWKQQILFFFFGDY